MQIVPHSSSIAFAVDQEFEWDDMGPLDVYQIIPWDKFDKNIF
jgi:hypothetical protein